MGSKNNLLTYYGRMLMKRTRLQSDRHNFTLFLLLCILLFTICTENVSSEAVISISLQEQASAGEESFTVNVYVEPEEPVSGIQFDLIFNSSLVSVKDVREGELLKQSGSDTMFSPGEVDNSKGTVTGIYGFIMGKDEATAPGIFAAIDLTSTGGNGFYELQLSNVVISDSNGHAVPVRVVDGTAGTEDTATSPAEKLLKMTRPGEDNEEETFLSPQSTNSLESQDPELEPVAEEGSSEVNEPLSSGSENIQSEAGQENQEYHTLAGIMGAGALCLAALFCLREIKSGKD